MSIFEFVLTGLTLVLALVLTRLLGALRWVFHSDRRYWVHALLVCNLLLLCTLIWWGLWYLRDAEWGYLAFTYNLLVGPGIFFVLAATLVPDVPRRVRDWEGYYYRIHRLFWGTMAVSGGCDVYRIDGVHRHAARAPHSNRAGCSASAVACRYRVNKPALCTGRLRWVWPGQCLQLWCCLRARRAWDAMNKTHLRC